MEVGEIRLDGTKRTTEDILEVLLENEDYKKLTFYSLIHDREQIDFIYKSRLGYVECSVVREVDQYTGYVKHNDIYYAIPENRIKDIYNQIIIYIITNKFKEVC